MQIKRFKNGGGVVHRLHITDSVCRFSVWYDADGNYVDAERIDAMSRSYKPTRAQIAELQKRLSFVHLHESMHILERALHGKAPHLVGPATKY